MTDTLMPPQTFRKTTGIHRIGLRTTRPPAIDVLPGTIYFSTDTLLLHRSDGVAWDPYSIPPVTIPFVFYYRADTTSTAQNDPGAGRIKWNNANQQLATSLYVDVLTTRGFDAVLFYKLVGSQDEIIIQDQDVSQNYQLWKLTADPIQYADWFEVPVSLVSFSGAGTMQNNQEIAVIIKTGGNAGTGGGGTGGTPDPHHTTHEPGGTDRIQNVAWTNLVNTFTTYQIIAPPAGTPGMIQLRDQSGEGGLLVLSDLTAPADLRTFYFRSQGGGFAIQAVNDLGGFKHGLGWYNGVLILRSGSFIPEIFLGQDDPANPRLRAAPGALELLRMDATDRVVLLAKGLGDTPLDASQLLSGTVPDTRLSPNVLTHAGGYPGGNTTFLREDGVFIAPPAGTGPEGPPGPPGPQGPQGDPGTDGVDGADGLPGAKGDQGDPGPTGATGPPGPQGLQGLPGTDGADGTDGIDGTDGLPGPPGPPGPKGDQGDQGIQGIQGIQGVPGADGGTTPHHALHEPGGTDALVGAAWLDALNIFTRPQQINNRSVFPQSIPTLRFNDAIQPVDQRFFDILVQNQVFSIAAIDDGHATMQGYVSMTRAGVFTAAAGLGTTPLNASQLLSGTVPLARLPATMPPTAHHTTHEPGGSDALANAAWTNQTNVFTVQQRFQATGEVELRLTDLSRAVDSRVFRVLNTGGFFFVQATDDAVTVQQGAFQVDRAGSIYASGQVNAAGLAGTPLNASNLSAGTVPDARLSSNVALRNSGVPFTVAQTITGSGIAELDLTDTAGVNVRLISYQNLFQVYSNTLGTFALAVNPVNGDVAVNNGINERGRTTKMGDWIDFSPTLGANAGTVTLAGLYSCRYMLIGRTLWVNIYLSITLDANPSNLYFYYPAGITCQAYSQVTAWTSPGSTGAGSISGLWTTQPNLTYAILQLVPSAGFIAGQQWMVGNLVVNF